MYQISEENVAFFARKSQKMPFLGLKKPRIGDTMVIHFSHGTQLTRVNPAGAGQGYQIQATRWRELSLFFVGARWYIFNMNIFITEVYHQSDTEILTMEGTFLLVYEMYH